MNRREFIEAGKRIGVAGLGAGVFILPSGLEAGEDSIRTSFCTSSFPEAWTAPTCSMPDPWP